MTLTSDQQTVANDLAKFIIFKKLEINTPEDLQAVFLQYLKEGSVSNWFFTIADDHQKQQFTKALINEVA